jgi:hypothetical protein
VIRLSLAADIRFADDAPPFADVALDHEQRLHTVARP